MNNRVYSIFGFAMLGLMSIVQWSGFFAGFNGDVFASRRFRARHPTYDSGKSGRFASQLRWFALIVRWKIAGEERPEENRIRCLLNFI